MNTPDKSQLSNNTMEHNERFELNGIWYMPIKKTPLKVSPKVSGILAMGAMIYYQYIYPYAGYGQGYSRQLPDGINIIKEYGLIQQKKSTLSKWERDAVVRIFTNTFTACE